MDEKSHKASFVCHVEYDFGGRVPLVQGIQEGLPIILDVFQDYKIKGIFFISTEILDVCDELISDIVSKGHTIGSHGHFHHRFKEEWRAENDRQISNAFLQSKKKLYWIPYCAPKFYYRAPGERWAHPFGQVSILKHSWVPLPIPDSPIFYIHPFDLVVPKYKAPNLFCKLLYSHPKKVRTTLEKLCGLYS